MAQALSIQTTITLKSGAQIPQLGFGVWDSPQDKTTASCLTALKHGYRHIDTAQVYGNETEVGLAIAQSQIPRQDLYITSKILSPASTPEETYHACLTSIQKISPNTPKEKGYLDLLLIHNGQTLGPDGLQRLWPTLEKLHTENHLRSIGVSNTGIALLESMRPWARIWPPHINQLELHPWCQQREVVAYCREQGIVVEAYCPLVRNRKAGDATLRGIAERHGKTTAQVLVRYGLEKGWVPLPKSDDPGRIAENADVFDFELGEGDVARLDEVGEANKEVLVVEVDNEKME